MGASLAELPLGPARQTREGYAVGIGTPEIVQSFA